MAALPPAFVRAEIWAPVRSHASVVLSCAVVCLAALGALGCDEPQETSVEAEAPPLPVTTHRPDGTASPDATTTGGAPTKEATPAAQGSETTVDTSETTDKQAAGSEGGGGSPSVPSPATARPTQKPDPQEEIPVYPYSEGQKRNGLLLGR